MIIVTGGAGFIGSNIVKTLNERGRNDILVVDDLQDGVKFRNIADCDIADYWDKDAFLAFIESGKSFPVEVDAVFHEGACSSTTEWDGKYMMQNNFEYSKSLLHYCLEHKIPYLYASSASVYGAGPNFKEERQFEEPLNVYGYSKFLFDQYVRRILPSAESQVVGFRYFNVYGPREQHKGSMSSVAFHLNNQLLAGDEVVVQREIDGGIEEVALKLPAVISTDLRLNEPRFVKLPNIMAAKKKPLEKLTPADLGVDTALRIEVVKYAEPKARQAGVKVADVAELVAKLKNEAKVI